MFLKLLILSDQQFKTQMYSIYKDIKQREVANLHILIANQRIWGIFAKKKKVDRLID